MNENTKRTLWNISFILIGVSIGLVIMPTFYYSADQMIESCNMQFGTGNWNVTKIDNTWYCSGLSVQYFDVNCVDAGICNVSELPDKYTLDLTNKSLTIISELP